MRTAPPEPGSAAASVPTAIGRAAPVPATRSSRPWLALVVAVALLHGLFYAVEIPPWDVFDEEQHLGYALFLRDHHQVPTMSQPLQPEIVASAFATHRHHVFRTSPQDTIEGVEKDLYEAWQPPLYHLSIAPLTVPAGHDALRAMYIARMSGPVLLALLSALTWFLSLHWFPRLGRRAAGAAALTVAAVTGAAEAAGKVNNDLFVGVLVTLVLLCATRLVERPSRRRALVLGCAAGAAILAKESGVLVLPVIVVALALLGRRRLSLPVVALALAPALIALASWSFWTERQYGTLYGSRAFLAFWHPYSSVGPVTLVRLLITDGWSSYWAAYGGGGLQIAVVLTLAAGAAAGAGALLLRSTRPVLPLALTGTLLLAFLAATVAADRSTIGLPSARYQLGLYPAVIVLVVAGWHHLRDGRLLVLVPPVAAGIASAVFAAGWFVPFFGLRG